LPPGVYTWETRCKTRDGAPVFSKNCATDTNLNGPTYLAGGTAKGTFMVNTATAHNDRYDRGFLTLSSNRKFLKQGTTTVPFFWLGDTAWGTVGSARSSDWNNYLSGRHQQGFSVLLFDTAPAFAGVRESTAFQKMANCQQDGPVPNNCSRWMPAYWQQYEAKVQDANAAGMVVVVAGIMEPFSYPSPNFGSPQWLSIFGRNLAARLAGHHVIFSPGSDDALTAQTQTLINSVGAAIRQAVPSNQAVPGQLITYHAGGSSKCTDYTGFLQSQTWHDFHLYQSGHCTGNPPIIQPGQEQSCDPLRKYNHSLFPNAIDETLEQCVTRRAREVSINLFNASNLTKPAVNGEAVYDNDPASPAASPSPENRPFLRQTAYLSVLSGSFGFTYGADYFSLWHVQSATLASELGPVPATAGMVPQPAAAHSAWDMQRMAAILKLRPWKELVPEPGKILNQQILSTKTMVYAHTNNYIYNIAYLPSDAGNSKIRLDLGALQPAFACAGSTGATNWIASWIDPVSNRDPLPATPPLCVPASGVAAAFDFIKPGACPSCDWILTIDRMGAAPPSGVAASTNLLRLWPDPTDGAATINAQVFDSTGAAASAMVALSPPATKPYFRKEPRVVPDIEGGFFTVWESEYQDGSLWGVFGRKLDAQGQPLSAEFQVNTYTDGDQGEPAVASSAAGNAVVVWTSFGQDGDQGGIYGQLYDQSGFTDGFEFRVNTTTAGHQGSPLVGMSDDGGFVVAWESDGQDGDGLGIYAQRYDSSGLPVGSELQVNPNAAGDQVLANLTVDAGGGFVVTWYDYDAAGNLLDTAFRSFDNTGQTSKLRQHDELM
jgi:hypothetical protein